MKSRLKPIRGRVASPTRGVAVVERLEKIGKTRADLAAYMEVSPSRVSKICAGDDMLISEATNMCDFLLWTTADLLENSPELRPTNIIDVEDEIQELMKLMSRPSKKAWLYWLTTDFRERINTNSYAQVRARIEELRCQAAQQIEEDPTTHRLSHPMWNRRATDTQDT